MLRIHRVARYVILEAANQYTLSEVEARLSAELGQVGNAPVMLILDIRDSETAPTQAELEDFGRFLGSMSEKISGGVYITGDDLRYGLANMVITNARLGSVFERVRIDDAKSERH